jgi:AcrR family transcriptional regulator
MSRPQKASDEQVFAAAARVMARVDPAELTLAAIAAEAGVTAGALVQRFGSRRALQLALAERMARDTPDLFSTLRSRYRSPLAALRAYAACHAGMSKSPAAVARSFAYLLQDLTDVDLKMRVLEQARTTSAGLRTLVADAVAHGELARDTDVRSLARLIQAVIAGSLLAWAFHQKGSAVRWITRDLDEVLRKHLPSS